MTNMELPLDCIKATRYTAHLLFYSVFYPPLAHIECFREICVFMLNDNIPFLVILSVSKGVPFSGWGCPSSMHEIPRGHLCLEPRYTPPVLASEADATKFLIFLQRISTRPFYFYFITILSDRWQQLDFVLGEGQGILCLRIFWG